MSSLLLSLVRGTRFRQFVDFMSPSFFEVIPSGALWKEAKSLVSEYRSKDRYRDALEGMRPVVEPFGVTLDSGAEPSPLDALDGAARRSLGQRVLEVYFAQLASLRPTLLDLGKSAWGVQDGAAVWKPGSGQKTWDPDFIRALVDVYDAFYVGGDDALKPALARLGLEEAEDLFKAHFGEGDQTAVHFRTPHFTDSFHRVFVRCRERGVKLHTDFLPLGICLATLYQTLETLEEPFDVRSAYTRAREAAGEK